MQAREGIDRGLSWVGLTTIVRRGLKFKHSCRRHIIALTKNAALCSSIEYMATAGGGSSRIKWITDLEKTVLLSNFEKRGWMRGSSEGRVFCDVK